MVGSAIPMGVVEPGWACCYVSGTVGSGVPFLQSLCPYVATKCMSELRLSSWTFLDVTHEDLEVDVCDPFAGPPPVFPGLPFS